MPALDTTAVGRAYRESSGRAVATLVRLFGDIDLAEEAVQEAFAIAEHEVHEAVGGVAQRVQAIATSSAMNQLSLPGPVAGEKLHGISVQLSV